MRPRRAHMYGVVGPLPVMFGRPPAIGIRWDPLFLVPMNSRGNDAIRKMANVGKVTSHEKAVLLKDRGDTLLIDNWRCLHGRSRVPQHSMGREIERVFLSRTS